MKSLLKNDWKKKTTLNGYNNNLLNTQRRSLTFADLCEVRTVLSPEMLGYLPIGVPDSPGFMTI